MQSGLASVLSVKCAKCGNKFCIESSKRVKAADGHQQWVVNVAAVLGQMATGGGAISLTCSMAPMNVPAIPKKLFYHVFGDHSQFNPSFCKAAVSSNNDHINSDSDTDYEHDNTSMHDDPQQPLIEQLDGIVANELDDEPTATDELDARNGEQTMSSSPIRPIEKVEAAGDRLVVLSASLIDNETSNLASRMLHVNNNCVGQLTSITCRFYVCFFLYDSPI